MSRARKTRSVRVSGVISKFRLVVCCCHVLAQKRASRPAGAQRQRELLLAFLEVHPNCESPTNSSLPTARWKLPVAKNLNMRSSFLSVEIPRALYHPISDLLTTPSPGAWDTVLRDSSLEKQLQAIRRAEEVAARIFFFPKIKLFSLSGSSSAHSQRTVRFDRRN